MQSMKQNTSRCHRLAAHKEDSEMGKVYQGTLELIGNTPLVEFVNIEKELGLEAKILAKRE